MKKGIHNVYLKKQKSKCYSTTFYSIFNMSLCRKLEIQNGLPKITKINWICFVLTNWSKIINYVDSISLTTVQLIFENREIKINKKVTPPVWFESATLVLRQNDAQRKLPNTPLIDELYTENPRAYWRLMYTRFDEWNQMAANLFFSSD